MEYDSRPDNIVHEAVEMAVNANPRLALEPYYQMKTAAILLARRIIALEEALKTTPPDAIFVRDENGERKLMRYIGPTIEELRQQAKEDK